MEWRLIGRKYETKLKVFFICYFNDVPGKEENRAQPPDLHRTGCLRRFVDLDFPGKQTSKEPKAHGKLDLLGYMTFPSGHFLGIKTWRMMNQKL